MSLDPFLRYLGVEPTAPPAELLDLPPDDQRNPGRIEEAFRRRLAQIYAHPDHRSPDAEVVLKAVRNAADELRRQVGRHGPVRRPPPHVLTEFDRNVLAVLVGYGGWNAQSRSRLVALAATQGVTVFGLMKVIRGLGEYARTGGPRLAFSQITPTLANGIGHSVDQPTSNGWSMSDALLQRLLPEIEEQSRNTIKLSVLFGVLTLVLGLLVLSLVLPIAQPPVRSDDAAVAAPPPGGGSAVQPGVPVRVGDAGPDDLIRARPTPLDEPLTFVGIARPDDAVRAAESVKAELEALDEVARRLSITDDPSEAVFRSWDVAIEAFATGWVLLDDSSLRAIEAAIIDTLFAAAGPRGSPTVTDRLLRSIHPPGSGALRSGDPLEVWRGAWCAGLLGRISVHGTLPPAVSDQARRQLHRAIAGPDAPRSLDFNTAAAEWLESVVTNLVEATGDEQVAYDRWELWLGAQHRLPNGQRFERSLMHATKVILDQRPAVVRSAPLVNVLGRLVGAADFETSPAVKRAVSARGGIFDDHAITSENLWLFTSVLAQQRDLRWFDESLIVPPEADVRLRGRFRDDIERRWPDMPASVIETRRDGAPIAVDRDAAGNWLEQKRSQHEQGPQRDAETLMQQLLAAARLNEAAAHLVAQEPDRASRTLVQLARDFASEARSSGPPSRPDRIIAVEGGEGNWAAVYEQHRRNTEEKIRLLESLQRAAGDDLHMSDAAVFVREVYRGSPAEVRTTAQRVLVQKMRNAPNVAMEMLDQFPDAPRNQATSDVLREFTGVVLPRAGTGAWRIEARLALVDHALSMMRGHESPVDDLARELAGTRTSQVLALRAGEARLSETSSPTVASGQLLASWRSLAQVTEMPEGIARDYARFAGRQNVRTAIVEGPVQEFVANQLGVLDLLAFVTIAEQPHMERTVRDLVAAATRERMEVESVLVQALHVERAMNRLWRLRMGLAMEEQAAASSRSFGVDIGYGSAFDARWAVPALLANASGRWSVESASKNRKTIAERLEGLDPSRPAEYFLLAEEAADVGDRDLARHLFALAAVLSPERYGRSACLALADLEEREHQRRRLRLLAALLAPAASGNASFIARGIDSDDAAVLALCEAFSFYRRGLGSRARSLLDQAGAAELLQAIDHALPGGSRRFLDDARAVRNRPQLSSRRIEQLLLIEMALLSGQDRPWSAELALSAHRPLIEADPTRLDEALGIDASRPRYREGQWVP